MCTAASPEIMCVVHIMKILRTPGICGKGVMVEDSLTINSPYPVVSSFYLNTDYYVCIIYTYMDKQMLSVVTSAVWLSCKQYDMC